MNTLTDQRKIHEISTFQTHSKDNNAIKPETMALSHIQPKIGILYVDNTLVIIKKEQQEKMCETINIFARNKSHKGRRKQNTILSEYTEYPAEETRAK